ncbi:ribosome silencing factor [Rosettibacter firmus]|uniref:ribosome silencing factor n=1 Tax=Rosettibacter firmus TaxID=3111522 RepID=UPI00336BCCC5
MDSLKFAKQIAQLILNKKGYDIKILDIRKISTISDFFVICSAEVDKQVKAIADEVEEKLTKKGIKCFSKEGYETLNWVILDYFDVIVHIFRNETRNYYNLEKLWGDAPLISFDNEEESTIKSTNKKSKSTTKKKTE